MKLSTTTAIYRDRSEGKAKIPVIDCVKRLHQIGYEDVDINFNLMSKYPLELSEENWMDWAKALRELLVESNMTALQCHVPFYNVLAPFRIPNKEHTEEIIRRAIIAAGIIGIRTAVIHPGCCMGECDSSVNLHGNMEYLKPHIELASKYGVNIAAENLFDVMDITKGRRRQYGSYPEELMELCDTLRKSYDNVGICWDFGHGHVMGFDQPKVLEMLGDRLLALHVSDNFGVMDDHLLPYEGTIQWTPIVKTLKKVNYEGAFAYETHRLTANMPESMVDSALTYSYQLGKHLISLGEEQEEKDG